MGTVSKAKRIEAKKKYSVDLLRSDIMKGVLEDGASCPLARALTRKFKTENVFVDPDSIIVHHGNDKYETATPARLVKFIKRFDAISGKAYSDADGEYDDKKEKRLRKALKPFRFNLKFDLIVPEETHTYGQDDADGSVYAD